MVGPVTQKKLHNIILRKGAVRAGATEDCEFSRDQHEDEGYSGTMYYANTNNMKRAENKLLEIGIPPYNQQEESIKLKKEKEEREKRKKKVEEENKTKTEEERKVAVDKWEEAWKKTEEEKHEKERGKEGYVYVIQGQTQQVTV